MLPERCTSELVDAGILCYRNKDFKKAIVCLQNALDTEPRNWRAKLYLGMSFYYSGDLLMASRQFRTLSSQCTDSDIKAKADAAMAAMQSQLKNCMPEMTCTIKRPVIDKPADLDAPAETDDADPDMEWVPQDTRQHQV